MRNCVLILTLLAWCGRADDACPSAFPSSILSATLLPSATTHRVLLRQSDGTYTAFEVANRPPYGNLLTIPNFARQLSSCLPPTDGVNLSGVTVVAQIASGGYIFALGNSVAVFDAGLNLIAEAPVTGVWPLVFVDLNGDGKPDIVGTQQMHDGSTALAVSLGNGGASFQPPVYYPIPGSGAIGSQVAVAVADLNGDQKPDLVVLATFYSTVSIYTGNGDGTFQAGRALASLNGGTALAIGDLNGDGKPDLVVASADPSTYTPVIQVALAAGDGTFGIPVSFPVTSAVLGVSAIAIGDVNGDGIPDIVASGISILFGDGKGGFANRRDVLAPALSGNLIVTDFNGDGITDIVSAVGNTSIMAGDAVSVLPGQGKGILLGPPVSVVPNYLAYNEFVALAAGDLTGDGIPDLVLVGLQGNVTVLKGAGDGSFQSTYQFLFASGHVPSGVVTADFNHDGKLDFAVVGSGFNGSGLGEVQVVLGNGDGTFQSPIDVPAPLGAFALAAGDFNRDGKTDVAVLISQEATAASDGVLILLGNGDGTFTAGATYPVGPYAQSIAAGDFHGDGKLDLVVADSGTYFASNVIGVNGNVLLLTGKGDGTFADPVAIPLPGSGFVRGPDTLAAGDFNRDGNLDLAVAFGWGGLVTMLGRGDGTFQPAVSYAVEGVVQAGDLNGVGIPDLVVGDSYLLGTGDGSFGPPVSFGTGSLVALADFNGDGKLDIAATVAGAVATYLNGTQPAPPVSVVSAASFTPGPIAPESIAAAFGKNFAAGATVSMVDSTGTAFQAAVLYASASQINFVVPAELDAGPAIVVIGSAGGGVRDQLANAVIAPAAPGLFTMNEEGLAAAYVTVAGGVTYAPVFSFQNGIFSAVPIDVSSGQAYLILFGTGLRNADGVSAYVTIDEARLEVNYAGSQPQYAGLDQVNVMLPASLAGSGCQILTVVAGNVYSNSVYVCIQPSR